MTKNEYAALNKEVLTLTEGTYGLGHLISTKEAADRLEGVKREWKVTPDAQIRICAEDIVEYAIAVGNISLEEDFAN